MGEQGTPIEGVEVKRKFTMAQLYKLADRYYLDKEWVKTALKYCGRDWLALQLRCDDKDEDIEPEGLPRRLYIDNVVSEKLNQNRFEVACHFSGAAWLELDEDSEKQVHEKNKTIVLLQGTGHVGVLVPPTTIMQVKRKPDGSEKLIPRPHSKAVEFSLHRWDKRGSFPRNVFFEGDDVKKEEGVPIKSPLGELCSRLSVNVEDLERSVSNLVLKTEEDWVRMNFYPPHFVVHKTVPSEMRRLLLKHGLGVDEVAKAKSA